MHKLWYDYVICPDYAREKRTNGKVRRDYIASPTGSQFTARLAEEFISIHGPRKLVAFEAMCQRRGPWSETINVSKKISGKFRTIECSKYEHELEQIERRELFYKGLNAQDIERREELMNLLPEKISSKTDEDLSAIIGKWTDKLNEKVFAPPSN